MTHGPSTRRLHLRTARRAVLVVCGALLLAAGSARAAGAPASGEDFLARYAATDRFRSGTPRAIRVTPKGDAVLFLRSGPRDRRQDLWSLDPRTGRESVLLTASKLLNGADETLTPEERARRERLRETAAGLTSYELSRDGAKLLAPLSGKLYVVDRASGRVQALASTAGPAQDAHFSPDGARVACVRDGDVWVTELATGVEKRLTTHEGDDVSWGSPEFVAQEEMGRFEGWWWSADSKSLLVQRTDTHGVERMRIADPANPGAAPQEWPYPRPGRANAEVRLYRFALEGGAPEEIVWDRAAFPYLCTVRADDDGVRLLVMDRAQQHEVLLMWRPGESPKPLLEERDEAFLNLAQSTPRALPAGRGFLWIAERDDSGPALEWRGADGALRARLTPPGLRVAALEWLAPDGASAIVRGWGADPTQTRLWRVDVGARARATLLADEPGLHEIAVAREGALRVRTLTPERGAARRLVEDARGRALAEVRSVAEDPGVEPAPAFERVGRDSICAYVLRPRDFDPSRRYPVVDDAYGGPHAQEVQRAGRRFLLAQSLADQGFIVVGIDGHGTPGRGRSWERAIRGDLIGPALEDHVSALGELCARHPEMDAARIGVSGWSFGGYFAAHAVMRHPETYAAGVAGAPVVDWRDYDTFYTERYLGLPGPDSVAYDRSSVLPVAPKLDRPLLVIHGTADDNVYFFNSLKLADALNRAGRRFDFLPLPGRTHIVADEPYVRRVHTATADYLRRTLGGPEVGARP